MSRYTIDAKSNLQTAKCRIIVFFQLYILSIPRFEDNSFCSEIIDHVQLIMSDNYCVQNFSSNIKQKLNRKITFNLTTFDNDFARYKK